MIQLTLLAIDSGKAAPITLGVISLKIIIRSAMEMVEIDKTKPLCPNKCSAKLVTKMGKMVLIKLFEISNTESKESMRWRRRSAMAAPGWP